MGGFYCVGIFAAAKIAHLSDDETVAKMGHPSFVVGLDMATHRNYIIFFKTLGRMELAKISI